MAYRNIEVLYVGGIKELYDYFYEKTDVKATMPHAKYISVGEDDLMVLVEYDNEKFEDASDTISEKVQRLRISTGEREDYQLYPFEVVCYLVQKGFLPATSILIKLE